MERLVNRLKGFRRFATRYEKWTIHYLRMLAVAAILLRLYAGDRERGPRAGSSGRFPGRAPEGPAADSGTGAPSRA